MEKKVKCPECKKEFTPGFNRWEIAFIEAKGMCEKCYNDSKGLIEVDGHYVPWSYRNYSEAKGDSVRTKDLFEDVNANLPKISFCDEYMKWKIEFTDTDLGGYDVQSFTWYFDMFSDLYRAMKE